MRTSTASIDIKNPAIAHIESINHDGRGVAHIDGKAVFIDGGLPSEEVRFVYSKRRRKFDEGKVVDIIKASLNRIQPTCNHSEICGGCSLQHLVPSEQILAKQQVLLDNLKHIGKVEPHTLLSPLTGPHQGYRHKARLGVKYVIKKESVFVGFREKRSSYLADLTSCTVLHPSVGTRIESLRSLISDLQAYRSIPQIEVAVGDDVTALVFRHLEPLAPVDLAKLRNFGQQNNLQIYLQSAGLDSIELLWPECGGLHYTLPDHEIRIEFQPADFMQINPAINRKMVNQMIELLDPQPQDNMLDLFCGLGNFTLPIARQVASVVGIEGDAQLVKRAQDNARINHIANAEFIAGDLQKENALSVVETKINKIVLDPPRLGAKEVIASLPKLDVARIVYVSCNPATLARDAGELVHKQGYTIKKAGVMDMFPHTTHVESIALFERS